MWCNCFISCSYYVFPQPQSTPEKDTDVLTAKAILKNSQKLILQMSWNWDFLHHLFEGTKDRIPAMSDAALKVINKYHTDHFGFDLNHGGIKIKNTVSNIIERAYHKAPISFNGLQHSIKHLSDQGRDMYREASDSLMSMRLHSILDMLAHNARGVFRYSEDKVYAFVDAAKQLLSKMKFEKTDRAIQTFSSLIKHIFRYIREVEFTIPGTDVVVHGSEIMDKLSSSMTFEYNELKFSVHQGFDLLRKTINDFIHAIAEKGQSFITYLQNENAVIASQVDAIHADIMQSSVQHIQEAKIRVAEYRDLTNLMIQEAFNALNMERVNNDTKEIITIFQSHLYGGLNEFVDLMRRTSQSTAPYIKVSKAKMDIEIPLPFIWKSFNEWPKQSMH